MFIVPGNLLVVALPTCSFVTGRLVLRSFTQQMDWETSRCLTRPRPGNSPIGRAGQPSFPAASSKAVSLPIYFCTIQWPGWGSSTMLMALAI
jgi:hypothetical protein